jgi:uncharacterized protein YqeY
MEKEKEIFHEQLHIIGDALLKALENAAKDCFKKHGTVHDTAVSLAAAQILGTTIAKIAAPASDDVFDEIADQFINQARDVAKHCVNEYRRVMINANDNTTN